jgi:hypothetical protein
MDTPKIVAALGDKAPRFQEQVAVLEQGLADKKIWNVQAADAKFAISRRIEEAGNVIVEPFFEQRRNCLPNWPKNDPRYDITGYMNVTSAPKLLRNLEKNNGFNNPLILEYMEYLREVVKIGALIKAIKPYIVKGRRPVEKTEEQLRDETFNTGECAICANRQKLNGSANMVMHGYQMSDYNHAGYRVGKCFGVSYKPYELSNEANVAFAPVLESLRKGVADSLKTLKSGKVASLTAKRDRWENHRRTVTDVVLTPEANPQEFKRELELAIARQESELRMVESDIKTNNAKIENWTRQPLKYGSKAQN